MYAYDIVRYLRDKDATQIRALIEQLRHIQMTDGSRRAVAYFLDEVGLYPLEVFNDAYYAEQLTFELGALMAHSGMNKEASQLLSLVGPGTGGDVTFPEHVRQYKDLHQQQMAASARGMLAPLFTSLPKSGSASLTQTLARSMSVPVTRLAAGFFPDFCLIEAWLKQWARGGMLNHDHFGASSHNLQVLQRASISRIVVQVRDPRPATWSYLKMRRRQGEEDGLKLELEDLFSTIYLYNIRWLEGWLSVAQKSPGLTIQWVHFQEFKARPHLVAASVLEPCASNRAMRSLLRRLRKRGADMVYANMNVGSDDEWRRHADVRLQQRMWEALPAELVSFLQLKA